MESGVFAVRIAILDRVGIQGDVSPDLWKAPQEEFCLGIEFANGCENDFVGYLHIANLTYQSQRFEVRDLVLDAVPCVAQEADEVILRGSNDEETEFVCYCWFVLLQTCCASTVSSGA